jgi:hypothetical protein
LDWCIVALSTVFRLKKVRFQHGTLIDLEIDWPWIYHRISVISGPLCS